MVLTLLILFLSAHCIILDDSQFMDPSFENNFNIIVEDDFDYFHMHQIKCIKNSNAPFSQYNLEDYNFEKEEYRYCARANLLDSNGHFFTMNATYEFLKNSKFITEQFPFLKSALENYYNKFDQLIDGISDAKTDFNALTSSNSGLLNTLSHLSQQHIYVESKKRELKKIFASIKSSEETCNKGNRYHINSYKNIVSSYNLKEYIDGIYQDLLKGVISVKNLCNKTPNIIPKQNKVSKTLETYDELITSLDNVRNDTENNFKILYSEFLKYSRLNDALPVPFSNTDHMYNQTKKEFESINGLFIDMQSKLLRKNELIRQISEQIPKFSRRKQKSMIYYIDNLKQHLQTFKNIENHAQDFGESLKKCQNIILESKNKHDLILKKARDSRKNIKLTIETLDTIMNIRNKLTYENYNQSLRILLEYYKSPCDYVLDTDSTIIAEYLEKIGSTHNQLIHLLENDYVLVNKYYKFSKEMYTYSNKMEEYYNKHKDKTMPEIKIEHTPENNNKLQEIDNINIDREKKRLNDSFKKKKDIYFYLEQMEENGNLTIVASLSTVLIFVAIVLLIVGGFAYFKNANPINKYEERKDSRDEF